MSKPRVGSLFSGVGAFDLALERAGWEVAWQVEVDPACRRVLARHWPAVPRYGDIREVDGAALAPVDVVVGGWPCQDHSVAGKRAGLAGERSGLFHHFARLVAQCRPRFVLAENVPGLLSQPEDFRAVLRALDDLGYVGGWRVLDAQFFGVPQRRRRVFLVAGLGADGARIPAILFEPEGGHGHPAPRREARQRVAASLVGGSGSPRSRGKVNGENADVNLVVGVDLQNTRLESTALAGTLDTTRASRGGGQAVMVAHALSAHGPRHDPNGEDFLVTHALTDPHGGVTEDGTGRGVPLVVQLGQTGSNGSNLNHDIAPTLESTARLAVLPFDTTQITSDKNYSAPRAGDTDLPLAAGMHAPSAMVRRLTPVECARLQGLPDDWLAAETDSTQYRLLGNAVCVPVAQWLGARLYAALHER